MNILFVNHAGFVISNGKKAIICDPWLTGRAFCSGWELMSPTAFRPDMFQTINYIWFSHEHPDHFSPLSLQTIPAIYRKHISILFHQGGTREVENFCTSLGFRSFTWLPPEPFEIDASFTISNTKYHGGDSWLHCVVDGYSILNTNDCSIASDYDAARIKRRVGHVDILLTKFSFASWVGNPDQPDLWAAASQAKLEMLLRQIEAFQPKFTIPMASQIVYCHEENIYLNNAVITPGVAAKYIAEHTNSKPVVLYPGDTFDGQKNLDSTNAILRYQEDFAFQRNRLLSEFVRVQNIPFSKLSEAIRALAARRPQLSSSPDMQNECVISLENLHLECLISAPNADLRRCVGMPPDIQMSSEMLHFCLEHPSHWDSLRLSGRMKLLRPNGYVKFSNVFKLLSEGNAASWSSIENSGKAHLLE
jgi:hypothetical protein